MGGVAFLSSGHRVYQYYTVLNLNDENRLRLANILKKNTHNQVFPINLHGLEIFEFDHIHPTIGA